MSKQDRPLATYLKGRQRENLKNQRRRARETKRKLDALVKDTITLRKSDAYNYVSATERVSRTFLEYCRSIGLISLEKKGLEVIVTRNNNG